MGTSHSDVIENDSYSVLVPELFPCWGRGADHAANRQSPSHGNSGVFANSEAVCLAQRAWTGTEAGKTS